MPERPPPDRARPCKELKKPVPSIIDRILKISDNRAVKRLRGITDAVNVLEDEFRAMTDAQVREETDRFKERLADGETLDQLLPEAFAAVREAAPCDPLELPPAW